MSGPGERLRERLEEVPVDCEAEARAWELVQAAYAARTSAPRRPRLRLRASLVLAGLTAAVAAAILSPPGRAVVDAVRRSIGIEHAAPALARLPAPGRILAAGPGGAWVIAADGSRRRLGEYAQAAWSPHALYVVAASRDELAAVEPDGRVHWALARRGVSLPAWGGTLTDTRVAYLAGGRLHVVAGNGSGDRTLSPAAAVRPVWRPSDPGLFVLAWVSRDRRVVVGVPGRTPLWRSKRLDPAPRLLAWSPDGRTLAVATPSRLLLLDGRTGAPSVLPLGGVRALAYARDGSLALVRGHSVLGVGPEGTRTLFSAPGRLAGLAWSPDGRWLVTSLPAAGQWVFVGPKRVAAVSNVRRQLGGTFAPDGWAP
jgi:WD40-like Beta Propeller Repeat